MSQLPAQLPDNLQSSPLYPHFQSAYQICLDLESKIQSRLPSSSRKDRNIPRRNLICSRIVGYLLHHAPNEHARHQVQREIMSCSDEPALLELGQMYLDHWIRTSLSTVRSSKECTPTPSAHASRPSFDKLSDEIAWILENTPQDHSRAKQLALARDGYHCVLTGSYDQHSVMTKEEIRKKLPLGALPVHVHCAHIFPESTNKDLEVVDKVGYASTVWTIMSNFGYPHIVKELNGSNIHRLENILTLEINAHTYFDELSIWFVPTGTPNQYKVESRFYWLKAGYPQYITLTTDDPEKLPLPSPEYLAICASCARIAHLSGAGEYIDKVLRDMEDTQVLAEDGGSATLLEDVLLHVKALGITRNSCSRGS